MFCPIWRVWAQYKIKRLSEVKFFDFFLSAIYLKETLCNFFLIMHFTELFVSDYNQSQRKFCRRMWSVDIKTRSMNIPTIMKIKIILMLWLHLLKHSICDITKIYIKHNNSIVRCMQSECSSLRNGSISIMIKKLY